MLPARKVLVDMNNAQYHFININVCCNLKSASQMARTRYENALFLCSFKSMNHYSEKNKCD